MSLNPLRSITAQLSRLSIGISRTSVRLASSKQKKKKKGEEDKQPHTFPPGHGSKIWIFSHYLNGLTVYSMTPVLKATRALRQIPFNGKKLKPSKLRKDFWKPVAMIQIPEGLEVVGRSVFHLMREFRMKHELEWDYDMFRDEETGKSLNRRERGKALNNQKANSIADMAAVLGGTGKGNKMWMAPEGEAEKHVEMTGEQNTDANGKTRGLVKVQIWWTNNLDKKFARKWPANVSHHTFKTGVLVPVESEDKPETEGQEEEGEGQEQKEGESQEPKDGGNPEVQPEVIQPKYQQQYQQQSL